MTPDSDLPADQPEDPARPGLSPRDQDILTFEAENTFWRQPGAREQAIRTRFSLRSITYHQILNQLLDDPAALAYAPTVVNRLRALRETRTRRHHRP